MDGPIVTGPLDDTPEDAPTYRRVSRHQYRVTGIRQGTWHADHDVTLTRGSDATTLQLPRTHGLQIGDEVWVTVEVRE